MAAHAIDLLCFVAVKYSKTLQKKKDENEKSAKKEKSVVSISAITRQPLIDMSTSTALSSSACLVSMGRGSIERSFRQRKKNNDSTDTMTT